MKSCARGTSCRRRLRHGPISTSLARRGPWVTPERERLIERFKFYNRFAGGSRSLVRWPLQQVARWRCANDFYALPVEKLVVERLKPQPKLS